MKLSHLNIKKINLKDVDKSYPVQDILMKAGELYQFESGIYGYGHLWTKLERKVEEIIIDELDKADCIQVEWPKLQPKKIWDQSNRWDAYTKDSDTMFTLNNNLGEYGLAPTAEECATIFGANRLKSYKSLPATYYQIGEKFRKEIRARGYLFRPRTFVMMDAYSFDKTQEDMKKSYDKMHDVYLKIFNRLGIKIIPTISDNGLIGGSVAEEFQAALPIGEDVIYYDETNNIGLNQELMDSPNKDRYLQMFGIEDVSKLQKYQTVELGNNFQLGTKYSKSMGLYYTDENQEQKPYYMGCYGIGLGRIIATILENSVIIKDNQIMGFVLPYNISIYKVQIIYKDEYLNDAKEIYEMLMNNQINCVLDDRIDTSIGTKIKDCYILGTPYMIVLGNKWDNKNIEIENLADNTKVMCDKDNLIDFFKNKEK